MRQWWPKKPDSVPVAPPAPDGEQKTVGISKYIQAWNLLRKIPVQKMFPAVISVGAVVFLAISGLIAWLVVFGSFVLRLFKVLL